MSRLACITNCFRVLHTLTGHTGELSCARFSYDESIIATSSVDRTCGIWDVKEGVNNNYTVEPV